MVKTMKEEERERRAGNIVASLLFKVSPAENSLSNHITRTPTECSLFFRGVSGFFVGKDSMPPVETVAAVLQCIGLA